MTGCSTGEEDATAPVSTAIVTATLTASPTPSPSQTPEPTPTEEASAEPDPDECARPRVVVDEVDWETEDIPFPKQGLDMKLLNGCLLEDLVGGLGPSEWARSLQPSMKARILVLRSVSQVNTPQPEFLTLDDAEPEHVHPQGVAVVKSTTDLDFFASHSRRSLCLCAA